MKELESITILHCGLEVETIVAGMSTQTSDVLLYDGAYELAHWREAGFISEDTCRAVMESIRQHDAWSVGGFTIQYNYA